MDDRQAFKQAVAQIYSHSSREESKHAEDWLTSWRKQSSAWATADSILYDASSTEDEKYMAAHTLCTKVCPVFAQRSAMAVPNGRGRHEHGGNRSSSRRSVTSSSLKHRSNLYQLLAEPCVRALMMCLQTQRDFEELPAESAASLRDSLVKLFIQYGAGPRTVRMQLCVAIASLAVHVPSGQFGEGGVIGWLFAKLQHESSPNVAVTCMLELLVALPQVCLRH